MLNYLMRRILAVIPTLLIISALVFIIIELPEGDYLDSYIAVLETTGERVDHNQIAFLRAHYGLDKTGIERYFLWLYGLVQGDFGYSFEYNLPVSEVVGDRLFLSFIVSLSTILFIYLISFPIGIYSAIRQYSLGDYGFTFLGYVGLSVPNFLLALILMYSAQRWFGTDIGGLMDDRFHNQPWSFDKALSIAAHLWAPVLVIGSSGTAAMIRRLRANLLDELQRHYVITARAKGVPPMRLILKYPLRLALNPFIADIGNLLPQIISGAAITSIVLGLPTTGPMLLRALQSQDMYLAGSFLMFLALLTVIGMLVSDLALALLDPRIRLGADKLS